MRSQDSVWLKTSHFPQNLLVAHISSAPITSSVAATLSLLELLSSILVTLWPFNLKMSYFPTLPASLVTYWATLVSPEMSSPSNFGFLPPLATLAFLAPSTFLDPRAFHAPLEFFPPTAFMWLWFEFFSVSFNWRLMASCTLAIFNKQSKVTAPSCSEILRRKWL